MVDPWQGAGLGKALSVMLAERARELGIARFEATLLMENRAMMGLLESLGPVRTVGREGSAVVVTLELPEAGIGEHMAGVLRVAATGDVEVVPGDGRAGPARLGLRGRGGRLAHEAGDHLRQRLGLVERDERLRVVDPTPGARPGSPLARRSAWASLKKRSSRPQVSRTGIVEPEKLLRGLERVALVHVDRELAACPAGSPGSCGRLGPRRQQLVRRASLRERAVRRPPGERRPGTAAPSPSSRRGFAPSVGTS